MADNKLPTYLVIVPIGELPPLCRVNFIQVTISSGNGYSLQGLLIDLRVTHFQWCRKLFGRVDAPNVAVKVKRRLKSDFISLLA